MRRFIHWPAQTKVAVGMVCFLMMAGPAQAQRPGPGRGEPRYDPATVTTVGGRLLSVDTIAGPGAMAGVHLRMLLDTRDTMLVYAGPGWYLAEQGGAFTAGERLGVTGSRTTVKGTPALIASEIRRERNVIRLRDRNGVPRWSRSGRSGPAPRRP